MANEDITIEMAHHHRLHSVVLTGSSRRLTASSHRHRMALACTRSSLPSSSLEDIEHSQVIAVGRMIGGLYILEPRYFNKEVIDSFISAVPSFFYFCCSKLPALILINTSYCLFKF
ncbi:hypothetical protein Syun_027235 [Stephania yunnanensis]|uniref:Uncharacterized protein n=1 Tax=Stephania yunnanensis TaxID=152371 RepID=A0AAP0HMM0_9MAGN